MPKYDAFGREIGEDTLAGLGGEPASQPRPALPSEPADGWSDAAAEPAAEPVSRSSPAEVPIAPPQQPQPPSFSIPGQIPVAGRPKRTRGVFGGLGCLFSLLVVGIVIAVPVFVVISLVGDTTNTIDDVRDAVDDATEDVPAPVDEAEQPPTGITGRSMMRPANLAAAIDVLRQQKGDLGNLILRPDRVNAELITKRDNATNVVLTYDGELRKGDPVDVGIPRDTIDWNLIDPAVPARFVKRSAERFDLNAARIDYVIGEHDAFDDEPLRWLAYFKGGAIVQGDENGRPEQRIS